MNIHIYFKFLNLISFFLFSACIASVSQPDYTVYQQIEKTQYSRQFDYQADVTGPMLSHWPDLIFEPVAKDIGHSVRPRLCPNHCNLHISILYNQANSQSTRDAVTLLTLFTLGLSPWSSPDNEFIVIFQYILPDKRVFIKSYNLTQHFEGNIIAIGDHLNYLNLEESRSILVPVFRQFFSDYEAAERTKSITPLYEIIRINDGRTYYFAKLTEKAGQSTLQLNNGKEITVPSYNIQEKKLMIKPISLFPGHAGYTK